MAVENCQGDSDAAEGEGPLDVCQVPQGRVWSGRVVTEKEHEDAFMLHFDGHRFPAEGCGASARFRSADGDDDRVQGLLLGKGRGSRPVPKQLKLVA
jgi:hypothetical protein